MNQRLAGRDGEQKAEAHLLSLGYKLVERNYQTRFGEIDLIVENDVYVVFAEVKQRRHKRFAPAGAFVTPGKQEKIRTTALLWLAEHPTALQPRFDVIEVYSQTGEINHIKNAF